MQRWLFRYVILYNKIISSSLYTPLQEKTVNMRHLTDENLSLKEETSILRVEVDKLQKDISTLKLVNKIQINLHFQIHIHTFQLLTSNSTRFRRSDVKRPFSSIQVWKVVACMHLTPHSYYICATYFDAKSDNDF